MHWLEKVHETRFETNQQLRLVGLKCGEHLFNLWPSDKFYPSKHRQNEICAESRRYLWRALTPLWCCAVKLSLGIYVPRNLPAEWTLDLSDSSLWVRHTGEVVIMWNERHMAEELIGLLCPSGWMSNLLAGKLMKTRWQPERPGWKQLRHVMCSGARKGSRCNPRDWLASSIQIQHRTHGDLPRFSSVELSSLRRPNEVDLCKFMFCRSEIVRYFTKSHRPICVVGTMHSPTTCLNSNCGTVNSNRRSNVG